MTGEIFTCGRRQGSSRSHWDRMKTSRRPMKSIKGPPPQTLARAGPIGAPTWQLQFAISMFLWRRRKVRLVKLYFLVITTAAVINDG